MTPAQSLALWADKLRDVAALGLMFSKNIYDRENYQVVQDIAIKMFALATGESLQQFEPLRAAVFDKPTPFASGDAAIINDVGEILLIRRADNRKWAMPGGALAVGETPAEGVVREAEEESGVRCQARALVGVYDSRFRGTISPHHLYQFVFLCHPLHDWAERQPASHTLEVLDAKWFTEVDLPDPLDPGHIRPIHDAFRMWRGEMQTFFDGMEASDE